MKPITRLLTLHINYLVHRQWYVIHAWKLLVKRQNSYFVTQSMKLECFLLYCGAINFQQPYSIIFSYLLTILVLQMTLCYYMVTRCVYNTKIELTYLSVCLLVKWVKAIYILHLHLTLESFFMKPKNIQPTLFDY